MFFCFVFYNTASIAFFMKNKPKIPMLLKKIKINIEYTEHIQTQKLLDFIEYTLLETC